MSEAPLDYDRFARDYQRYRIPDSRIAARLAPYLAGVDRLVNVGAGTGAYELGAPWVVAVEPSAEMIAARQHSSARCVRAVAEKLPFRDNSFDCAMAILSLHHWTDIRRGLTELARVADGNVLLLTWFGYQDNFWLVDYIPDIETVDGRLFPALEELEQILGPLQVETVPIPANCSDGMMCAYWQRPHCYLDAGVRGAISTFARLSDADVGLKLLSDDLDSGRWHQRYAHLRELDAIDLGYRIVSTRAVF